MVSNNIYSFYSDPMISDMIPGSCLCLTRKLIHGANGSKQVLVPLSQLSSQVSDHGLASADQGIDWSGP